MKKSIPELLKGVQYEPNRTPESGASTAFATLSKYRDGAIYVGHYSGSSEWERHPQGDEIVIALEGESTIILKTDGRDERIKLVTGDVTVVPQNTWHRFENSLNLKVLTVTPQPTDHQIDEPDE